MNLLKLFVFFLLTSNAYAKHVYYSYECKNDDYSISFNSNYYPGNEYIIKNNKTQEVVNAFDVNGFESYLTKDEALSFSIKSIKKSPKIYIKECEYDSEIQKLIMRCSARFDIPSEEC